MEAGSAVGLLKGRPKKKKGLPGKNLSLPTGLVSCCFQTQLSNEFSYWMMSVVSYLAMSNSPFITVMPIIFQKRY